MEPQRCGRWDQTEDQLLCYGKQWYLLVPNYLCKTRYYSPKYKVNTEGKYGIITVNNSHR